jgi:hypothetical protein
MTIPSWDEEQLPDRHLILEKEHPTPHRRQSQNNWTEARL